MMLNNWSVTHITITVLFVASRKRSEEQLIELHNNKSTDEVNKNSNKSLR